MITFASDMCFWLPQKRQRGMRERGNATEATEVEASSATILTIHGPSFYSLSIVW
jgi:hypothetical protein